MAKSTAAAQSTELAEKANHAVVASETVAFEDDAGGGFEAADAEAYAIPFLTILQSGSPQCKRSDGAYLAGAEEGKLINTVTQELFDGSVGVVVIPCYYKRSFIRWAPRETGGGFRGEVAPTDPMVLNAKNDADGYPIDDEGNNLVDTRTHYVLVLDDKGGYQPAVISCAASQLKKSRQWMSKMNGIKLTRADGSLFTPAMFSHQYLVTTTPESNDKGSWFGWKLEMSGPVRSNALYQAAKALRDAVSSGAVREQTPSSAQSTDAEEEF